MAKWRRGRDREAHCALRTARVVEEAEEFRLPFAPSLKLRDRATAHDQTAADAWLRYA